MAAEGAAPASCCARRSATCGEELDAMEAKGALPPKLKALKDELDRLGCRRAERAGGRGKDRASARWKPPPRHLLVLRLADLHQAEVAAVEHEDAGHRRHHPDRRADGADPAAQHLRAVVGRRARVQVHRADRLAGAGPRARGAGRGGQPPGEEGRRAVPDRSDALPARRSTRSRRSSPTPWLAARAGRVAEGRRGEGRRIAQRDRPGARADPGSQRAARARAQARRSRTASSSPPAPATSSTSSRPRPTCRSCEGQLDAARSAEAQARAARCRRGRASSRSSRSSAPR